MEYDIPIVELYMKNMLISKPSSIYCIKILIDSIYRILNEFVILEGDQQELWEIDYEKKIAINISESKHS